jgi:uncharacterized membrane protein
MRVLFILMFVANIVLTVVSVVVLPERVATHFGADGMADGWAPNHANAMLMTGVEVIAFCAIYFSVFLMRVLPARWVNLPNKAYWLSPANRARTMEKMQGFMWQFGAAVFLLMLVDGVLAIQANLAKTVRLNLYVFFPVFGAFLVYTIWWTVMIYREFRMPKGEGP